MHQSERRQRMNELILEYNRLAEADASSSFQPQLVDQGKKKKDLDEGGPGSGPRKKGAPIPGVDKGAKLPPVERITDDVFDTTLTDDQLARAIVALKTPSTIDKMGKNIYDPEHQAKVAHDKEKAMRDKAKKKESTTDKIKIQGSRLKEADATTKKGKRFRVAIIKEGLGNLSDAFYYSREALETAKPVFEGKKCYANHPGKDEQENRPERDVREAIGHFENCEVVTDDDGCAMLEADLVTIEGEDYDWARALCLHSIDYKEKHPDEEFIGLSINASGESTSQEAEKVLESAPSAAREKIQEAMANGKDEIRVVSAITDCVSADLVTEAGAGGKILKLLENNKPNLKRENSMSDDKEKQHDDADQDKALMSDMIKKHMGDDEEVTEADAASIGEMKQAYESLGHEGEEAVKMACAHHKVEKMKQTKKEAEAKEAAEMESEKAEETQEGAGVEAKESAKATSDIDKKLLETAGRLAAVETELRKANLEKHMDKKLEESRLPRSATKSFLEKAKSFRDEKDFNEKLAIFVEGYTNQKEKDTFSFFGEKAVHGERSTESLDLNEFVK